MRRRRRRRCFHVLCSNSRESFNKNMHKWIRIHCSGCVCVFRLRDKGHSKRQMKCMNLSSLNIYHWIWYMENRATLNQQHIKLKRLKGCNLVSWKQHAICRFIELFFLFFFSLSLLFYVYRFYFIVPIIPIKLACNQINSLHSLALNRRVSVVRWRPGWHWRFT